MANVYRTQSGVLRFAAIHEPISNTHGTLSARESRLIGLLCLERLPAPANKLQGLGSSSRNVYSRTIHPGEMH